MENWHKGNPMIPPVASKSSPETYTSEAMSRLQAIEQLSATHIGWFTHKNPYGCWICDLLALSYQTLLTLESYLMLPAGVSYQQQSTGSLDSYMKMEKEALNDQVRTKDS
jgi:hypothetical protein